MNRRLVIRLLFPALAAAVLLSGCGGDEDEIDQMINQAKTEAARPVPSSAVPPAVSDDELRFDQDSLSNKLLAIQEAKVKKAKQDAKLAAAVAKAKEAKSGTKVVASPAAATVTATSTETSTNTNTGSDVSADTSTDTSTDKTSTATTTAPVVYRKSTWGRPTKNNLLYVKIGAPVSAIWKYGDRYVSGYYLPLLLRNQDQNVPVVVSPADFKLYMNLDGYKKVLTGTANGTIEGKTAFDTALLFPNEKASAYLFFAFASFGPAVSQGNIWAPDNASVSWVRCYVGSPTIQFSY